MNINPDEEDAATIRLTSDEAVVLFELLSRWCSPEEGPTPPAECYQSPSECLALLRVLGSLESQLVAPFKDEYGDILAKARERLSAGMDYSTLVR
jgi:hypothetical protein